MFSISQTKDGSSTSDKPSTAAASDTQMFSGAEVVKVTPTVTGLMRKVRCLLCDDADGENQSCMSGNSCVF